ncbi:MAG: hypothetical protein ABIE74_08015 [Pseudomonadota bacterium]
MKRKLMLTLVAAAMLLITKVGLAAEIIPPYIYFNAYVTDGGGNLLDDGPIDVIFRIYDINSMLLYSEKQTVNILNGKTVASIGAGEALDTGAKMNGIPADVLKPSLDPRLEVEFVGYPAYGPDPFGAAPFSFYSQYAIGVMDGGVTASSIAKGAITYDHLSSSAKDELIDEITGGKGKSELVFQSDMVTFYRDPVQAQMIGVRPLATYGGGRNTLQGSLDMLDLSLALRKLEIDTATQERAVLQTNINNEATVRATGDTTITNIVNNLVSGQTPMIGDLNMGGKSITNVDKVDGVDVSAHKHTGTDGSASLPGLAKAWGIIQTVDDNGDDIIDRAILKRSYNVQSVTFYGEPDYANHFYVKMLSPCSTTSIVAVTGSCMSKHGGTDKYGKNGNPNGDGYAFTYDNTDNESATVACRFTGDNAVNDMGLKEFTIMMMCL